MDIFSSDTSNEQTLLNNDFTPTDNSMPNISFRLNPFSTSDNASVTSACHSNNSSVTHLHFSSISSPPLSPKDTSFIRRNMKRSYMDFHDESDTDFDNDLPPTSSCSSSRMIENIMAYENPSFSSLAITDIKPNTTLLHFESHKYKKHKNDSSSFHPSSNPINPFMGTNISLHQHNTSFPSQSSSPPTPTPANSTIGSPNNSELNNPNTHHNLQNIDQYFSSSSLSQSQASMESFNSKALTNSGYGPNSHDQQQLQHLINTNNQYPPPQNSYNNNNDFLNYTSCISSDQIQPRLSPDDDISMKNQTDNRSSKAQNMVFRMGYRPNCQKCIDKVPGHFSHIN